MLFVVPLLAFICSHAGFVVCCCVVGYGGVGCVHDVDVGVDAIAVVYYIIDGANVVVVVCSVGRVGVVDVVHDLWL